MTTFILICVAMGLAAVAIIVRPLIKGAERNSQQLTIGIVAIGLTMTAALLYSKIGNPSAISANPIQQMSSGPLAPVRQVIERARSEPENFEAQVQAADLYYRIQRYGEAIEYLNKANRLRPDDAEIMIRLGLANIQSGTLDAASAWLKSGLAKQPDNAVALEAYCLVLMHQGEKAQAEHILDHLAILDPNNPDLAQIRTALKGPNR